MGRLFCLLLLVSAYAAAQNEPSRKVDEYPAHISTQAFDLGAEFLVHSIPAERGALYADSYLVVEAAIYPKTPAVNIAAWNFRLEINHKKTLLFPQSAGIVAASLKYPDWEEHPTFIATGGIGDGQVMIGRPPLQPRFPGDNRPYEGRRPLPPRQGDPAEAPRPVDEVVANAALPEGDLHTPQKGLLYFAFSGKIKSIHSVVLLYESGRESVRLRLR